MSCLVFEWEMSWVFIEVLEKREKLLSQVGTHYLFIEVETWEDENFLYLFLKSWHKLAIIIKLLQTLEAFFDH